MATITQTELKVYAGTTTSGSQIGNTITEQGSPATVSLNLSSLGASLQAGHQYCVVARCTNSESYTTDWTAPYTFKTLIMASINTFTGGNSKVSPEMSFSYDNNVISVADCGVYLSTNASGTNAVKYSAADEQQAGQGWDIAVSENTIYYAIPFVVDDLGREYKGDWADAEATSSGYAYPTVTISNVATTYNSITGNVAVSSNDTISSVILQIIPTGGGNYQYKTLTAQTGTQTWSVTNGDLDDSSNPITINPSTEYSIRITATGTHSGSTDARVTATTAAQATATIAITSISGVTPTSAVVNLAYGTTPGQ